MAQSLSEKRNVKRIPLTSRGLEDRTVYRYVREISHIHFSAEHYYLGKQLLQINQMFFSE